MKTPDYQLFARRKRPAGHGALVAHPHQPERWVGWPRSRPSVVTIGAVAEAWLTLGEDATISSQHCVIEHRVAEDGTPRWLLSDNSTNGTRLVDFTESAGAARGRLLRLAKRMPTPVTSDTVIAIGDYAIRLWLPDLPRKTLEDDSSRTNPLFGVTTREQAGLAAIVGNPHRRRVMDAAVAVARRDGFDRYARRAVAAEAGIDKKSLRGHMDRINKDLGYQGDGASRRAIKLWADYRWHLVGEP